MAVVSRDPWPAWLVGVAGSFAVLEYLAVGHRRHLSLTSWLQRGLGIHPRARHSRLALVVLGGAWTLLLVHLLGDVEAK